MAWFRIDNRLVHGQVIEGWIPYLDVKELVVVNDKLAADELQQEIMQLAIPGRVRVTFVPLVKVKKLYDLLEEQGASTLYLLADCRDASRLVEQGIIMPVLNVGNMHYSLGKRQLCPHVAVDENDLHCLDALRQKGTQLDFRCIPSDSPVVEEW